MWMQLRAEPRSPCWRCHQREKAWSILQWPTNLQYSLLLLWTLGSLSLDKWTVWDWGITCRSCIDLEAVLLTLGSSSSSIYVFVLHYLRIMQMQTTYMYILLGRERRWPLMIDLKWSWNTKFDGISFVAFFLVFTNQSRSSCPHHRRWWQLSHQR